VVMEEARAQAEDEVVKVGPKDGRRSPATAGSSRRKKNSVSALCSSTTSHGEGYLVLGWLRDGEGVLTSGVLRWLDIGVQWRQ
jgi:hypothetical protein